MEPLINTDQPKLNITSVIINGCMHIAETRFPTNLTNRRVCRIYEPWNIRMPKMVLKERIGGTGIYSSKILGLRIRVQENFLTAQI